MIMYIGGTRLFKVVSWGSRPLKTSFLGISMKPLWINWGAVWAQPAFSTSFSRTNLLDSTKGTEKLIRDCTTITRGTFTILLIIVPRNPSEQPYLNMIGSKRSKSKCTKLRENLLGQLLPMLNNWRSSQSDNLTSSSLAIATPSTMTLPSLAMTYKNTRQLVRYRRKTRQSSMIMWGVLRRISSRKRKITVGTR